MHIPEKINRYEKLILFPSKKLFIDIFQEILINSRKQYLFTTIFHISFRTLKKNCLLEKNIYDLINTLFFKTYTKFYISRELTTLIRNNFNLDLN